MFASLHSDAGASLAIAIVCFAVGYVIGLNTAAKFGKATLWPSLVALVLCSFARATAAPLGLMAIGAVSLLHVAVGCLTVLLLRSASSNKPGNRR